MPVGQIVQHPLEVGGFQLPGGHILQGTPCVAVVLVAGKVFLADTLGLFDRDQVVVQLAQRRVALLRIEALADGSTIFCGGRFGFPLRRAVEGLEFLVAVLVFPDVHPVAVTAIRVLLVPCHKNFSSFGSGAS